MCAVGFLTDGPFASREDRDENEELVDFYSAVFSTNVFAGTTLAGAPTRIEVDDVDSALARVWDFGGTIVSASESVDGQLTRAAFRDPNGRLVTIILACEEAEEPSSAMR